MRTVKELTRKMKDSGVEWIGDIPEDWEVRKLGNISKLYTGNSIRDNEKDNYNSPINAIPYIATKDVGFDNKIDYNNGMYINKEDEKFKRALKGNTLICIEGGSAGRKIAKVEEEEVCFGNKLCCINSNVVNNDYIYYYSLAPNFSNGFQSRITGLIPGVTLLEMAQIEIIVPPEHEQKSIADFLDKKTQEIDNIISKTKKAIEEYKKYKQSLITETVTKGLDENVEMKDSGIEWIGEIPEHWQAIKLKYFYNIISGTTPTNKDENWNGEILWITPADYNTEDISIKDSKRKITKLGVENSSLSVIPIDSIIVSNRAPIGKIALNEKEVTINQGCKALVLKKIIDNKFTYYILSIYSDVLNMLGRAFL